MRKNKIACFISYSHDIKNIEKFKRIRSIVSNPNFYVDYSEKKDKSSFSDENIWEYLHKRIAGSSCTIVLLTEDLITYNRHKIEYKINDFINSGWVYNEISASLRDWKNNRINGVICIMDDTIVNSFNFSSAYEIHLKSTLLPEILEVNKNYIIFVSYSDFINNPHIFLSRAMQKRQEQIESNGTAYNIKYELHNKRLNK